MGGLSEVLAKLKAKDMLLGKGVGVYENMKHKLKLRGRSPVSSGQCRNTRARLERATEATECHVQENHLDFLNITLLCSVSISFIVFVIFLAQIYSFLFGSWILARIAQHTAC